MSLSSTSNRMPNYVGNNTADTFPYTFRIIADSDVVATVRDTETNEETTLVIDTDYTVTGAGEDDGGTIVLVDNGQDWLDADGDLATGFELTIRRVRPLTQNTDIRNQGDFYPEAHEDAFDHAVMILQQHQDEIDRSMKLPETIDPADFDMSLPVEMVGAASSVIITNADGDGFELGPTADEISGAQQSATDAEASASAAATSATNAATSATASAASAASAAAQLASAFFRDVVYVTSADSPLTITSAYNGKLLNINSSGGAIVVNLPTIAGVTLPFNLGVLIKTAGNNVTFNRGGTDTIMGATSKVFSVANVGAQFVADDSAAPDDWSILDFGAAADGSVTAAKLATSAVSGHTALTAVDSDDTIVVGDTSAAALKTVTYGNFVNPKVRTVTGADTTTINDRVILLNPSASHTLSLHAATGSKQILEFLKIDSDLTKNITLDGDGADTIGGTATTVIHTQGESLRIIDAAANTWQILDRRTNAYLGAITTASSWVANTTVTANYWREGSHLVAVIKAALGGAPTSAALTFTLPNSWAADTAKLLFTGSSALHLTGSAIIHDTSAGLTFIGAVGMNSASASLIDVRIMDDAAGGVNVGSVTQASPVTFASGDSVVITVRVPINGWNA